MLFVSLSGALFLGALSAYAVHTYFESGSFCGGLIQLDVYPPHPDCDRFLEPRRDLVAMTTAVAATTLVTGLLLAFSRRQFGLQPKPGPRLSAWRSGGWSIVGLVAPTIFLVGLLGVTVLADSSYFQEEFGLPLGWLHLSAPISGILVAWAASRHGLTRESAMAAAAVAIPAMTVIQFLPTYDLEGPPPIDELPLFLLSGVPFCLALIAVARLQNRGFFAPALVTSAGLSLVSAFVTTVVYLPQILPGWRDAIGGRETPSGGFSTMVWRSALLTMLVVSLVVVARAYVRSPHRSEDEPSELVN